MRITLESGPVGAYKLCSDDGAEVLFQVDFDYPCIASSFGWIPCPRGETDGTIDCIHRTAVDMIADARAYLDEHLGDTVGDPGYF